MNFKYTDENGEEKYPIMGCYGIGVGRMAASICEVRHDDYVQMMLNVKNTLISYMKHYRTRELK